MDEFFAELDPNGMYLSCFFVSSSLFFYACIHYLKSKCTCSYATLLDDNEAFAALDLNLPPEDEEWCSYVLTRILTLGSSKSKIPKIMFLCVTARPRFNEGGVCILTER